MTYWADNIKFIKDILDSKYKKIEDAIADVSETSEFVDGARIRIGADVICGPFLNAINNSDRFLNMIWGFAA